MRILDALREGDELVRLGLSEKTNFEVTLFRAVESGKSRSIDQVIRKISQVLPEDEKKNDAARTVNVQSHSSSPQVPAVSRKKSLLNFQRIILL